MTQHLNLMMKPPRCLNDLGKGESGKCRAQNVFSLLRATVL